jgi:hypothetical protein
LPLQTPISDLRFFAAAMDRTKVLLTGQSLEIVLTAANSAAQAWYGYDQGVISGILIGSNFIKTFPQTKVSSIQGITASCFSVSSSSSRGIGDS